MATFVRTGSKTKALIRKKGYPTRSKTFHKRIDAMAWARRIESEMERSCFDDSARLKQITLADALADYVKASLNRQLKATKFIVSHANTVSKHLGTLTLTDISTNVLADYRDQRLKAVSEATVKHELGIIYRAMKHSYSMLNIPQHTVPQVAAPTVRNARDRRISREELDSILEQISNSEVRVLITLALETGMRRSELLAMHWSDIDWNNSIVKVPITKTDKARWVPMSSVAKNILNRHQQATLSQSKVFSIRPDSLTQAFSRAAVKAQIEDIRFHDLRHEATTRFFEMNLSMMEVATITGHQDPRMLRRYTHIDSARLVDKLG